MKIHADTAILESAQRIAPIVREYSDEAERERRLSRPVLNALHESGLLRMFTPRSLGGLETDPITRALVIEEIAKHDTAAAWTLANPLDWAYLAARLSDEGAEEMYKNGPNILIASQFGRPMQGTPVRNGYRIKGRSPFISNCYDAQWIATTFLVEQKDPKTGEPAEPQMMMAYIPVENCQVIDTWDVIGMIGTGSNDVEVNDVFVPAYRTFPLVPEFAPGSHYRGPLYRFPLAGTIATNIPPIFLAVARRAIEEVSALAQAKVPVTTHSALRDRASAQARLAQAEALVRTARLFLLDILSETWEMTLAGEPIPLQRKADILLALVNAVQCSAQAVEFMHRVAGTTGIYNRNPLSRYFRDVQTLRHHAIGSETRYETVGQLYLGLPPDLPVITF